MSRRAGSGISGSQGSTAVPRDISAILASLQRDPRLVHVEHLAGSGARHARPSTPLPSAVDEAFGRPDLWSHQAEAIDLARAGNSVAIATGTASGKSLCFQIPIAESVSGDRPATALMLFPTKALAQDQLRSITAFDIPGLVAGTYDGDNSPEERAWVRRNANVILTNPDMLHAGLLPSHDQWNNFLHRLEYVVIDELHTMRGVFGSHVAHILRRLRRLCAHYGSDPTFILTSATIGQPGQLASELCGLPVAEVTEDASPRGERHFMLWNPSAEDPDSESTSSNRDTAELMSTMVAAGHRAIAFCRSRKGTEVVAAEVKRRLPAKLASSVRPYRGGYLRTERREIEQALFDGSLRGVVATSALELGIDVGGLDVCILNGFPGTIASMWQQAGRAGRQSQHSLAALVAGDDQLDHWFITHPDELFNRPPEPAVINPHNPHVLLPHLACAAYELPLTPADERWWGDSLDDAIRRLVLDDLLKLRPPTHRKGPAAVWAGRRRPSTGISLRSAGGDEFRIAQPDGTLIGTVDGARALRLIHPGATYLHQGETWKVTSLDLDDHVALVEPTDGGEYTQPRASTDIEILVTDQHRAIGGAELCLGEVLVRSTVTGYRRFNTYTGEQLGVHDLDLPPSELITRAFWYILDPSTLERAGLTPISSPGALHAVEHAAIGMMPLFTICDRWDVGGLSTPLLHDTGEATIVIYDGYPGGAGIAELGFEAGARHLEATLELIESCECVDGCPSCVQSPKCGNGNDPLDKHGAIALLHAILGPSSSDSR
jgi:DEAD/DEAH box helicase domain-containing protein